jgi:hypothetical protein
VETGCRGGQGSPRAVAPRKKNKNKQLCRCYHLNTAFRNPSIPEVILTHFTELSTLEKPPIMQLLKNFQNLKEPTGSLPCSQELSTGLYPDPDQFIAYHPITSL